MTTDQQRGFPWGEEEGRNHLTKLWCCLWKWNRVTVFLLLFPNYLFCRMDSICHCNVVWTGLQWWLGCLRSGSTTVCCLEVWALKKQANRPQKNPKVCFQVICTVDVRNDDENDKQYKKHTCLLLDLDLNNTVGYKWFCFHHTDSNEELDSPISVIWRHLDRQEDCAHRSLYEIQ